MGRVSKTYKNVLTNGSYYIIKTILSFVARTLFIHVLGMQFLGLNSLFYNILAILSLAELGIGSAIIYNMYKPMAEGDFEKVKSLLALYKKFYFVIAVIIGIVGVIIIPFIPQLVGEVENINVILAYVLTLLNVIISYFMAHRRALLLTSQNKSVEAIISICTCMLGFILQTIAIVVFKNYYLYLICIVLTTVVDSLIVFMVTKKMFWQVNGKTEPLEQSTKKQIISNTKAIMCHKIGGVVLNSTDSLVIQIVLCDLIALAIYSNYWLIYTTIVMLLSVVLDALQGSIGNLIAEKTPAESYVVFKRLYFAFMWLVSFCTIAIGCLSNSFISTMWGAENVWGEYFVLIIVTCFFVNMSRQLPYYFKISAGIFRQDRWAPLIEAFFNIVISVILVRFLGVSGVVLGTLISCLMVPFWNIPRVLFQEYFKVSLFDYWKRLFLYSIITFGVGMLSYYILSFIPSGGYGLLLIKFAACALLPNLFLIACYWWSDEFKYYLELLKTKITKKNKNNKDSIEN